VGVGPLDAAEYPASGVRVNCPKTITETAKILAYLLDQGLKVGYSLDFATITQGVHSRTLRNCGRDLGTDYLHSYGSEIAEGLSHAGMMKKWHKELETVGLKSTYLSKLKNDGAEAFLQMWERGEAKSKLGKQIPRQVFGNNLPRGKTCAEDSDCAKSEFCTAGIPNFTENACKPKKGRGATCTTKRQCTSGRCSFGFCADPDECRLDADCNGGEYCGDPVSGKRTCKALKSRGQACTRASQCATNRCAWGLCADPDECRSNAGCSSGQYCGDPVSGKRTCKDLLGKGKACTKGTQCRSGKCSFFRCG
jgi:hypothetical protein